MGQCLPSWWEGRTANHLLGAEVWISVWKSVELSFMASEVSLRALPGG